MGRKTAARIDLAGKVFGRWTVLRYVGNTKYRSALWECQCSCGEVRVVKAGSLISGRSSSCGCAAADNLKERQATKEGQRFGRLVLLERDYSIKSKHPYWRCRCDCGGEIVSRIDALSAGATVSCGCYNRELHTIHGKSRTRIFRTHYNMLLRCYVPTTVGYENYGGRGITVYEPWHDFVVFEKWAVENGYQDDLEIDRIDNNQGYSPDNCRWSTSLVQGANKRNVHRIEYGGEAKTISEWAEEKNIKRSTLRARLCKLKWSVKEALNTPAGKVKGGRL